MFGLFEKKYFCKDCHEVGVAAVSVPGSFVVEIFAWLLMILPGLLYTLWRNSAKKNVCRACGSEQIISVKLPLAKKLMAEAQKVA